MDDEDIPHDDPRFVEILEACLHMEIAGHKESYAKMQSEITTLKKSVLMKLEKRRDLKKKIEDAEDLISMLNVTLKKLQEHVRETEQRIEMIEANADDRSKVMSYEMQRYRVILKEYEEIWRSYHARYEEFPLAKKRKEAEISAKKALIEKMVLDFKVKEMEKIVEQKKKIDRIRTRTKIIEFVKVVTYNERLEKRLMDVKAEIDLSKQKLRSKQLELQSLREQEEEERKIRAMQLLEMPPPKINLSRVRLNYSREWQGLRYKKQTSDIDADSISVNTITLEEMCIRDETYEGTSKRQKVTEEPATPPMRNYRERGTSVSSRIDERETRTDKNMEILVEPTPLEKDPHGKRELSFTDTPKAIARESSFKERDARKRTTMQVREDEEKYAFTSERNKLAEDEHELKRMKKFLRSDEKTIENMEAESSRHSLLSKAASERETHVPRITKIEKVRYGVATMSMSRNAHEPSKSFALPNFEPNESRANSFSLNDSFMIKELNAMRSVQPSMYDENSSNFKLSECPNVSNISDTDINVESLDGECRNVDCKESEKGTPPKVTPRFNFSDLLKLKSDNFRLF